MLVLPPSKAVRLPAHRRLLYVLSPSRFPFFGYFSGILRLIAYSDKPAGPLWTEVLHQKLFQRGHERKSASG